MKVLVSKSLGTILQIKVSQSQWIVSMDCVLYYSEYKVKQQRKGSLVKACSCNAQLLIAGRKCKVGMKYFQIC